MWKPVDIPFQNSQPMPSLPTTDEIRACTKVVWERWGNKMVKLNDDVVVKDGRGCNGYIFREGQTLVFLERHAPAVPAPRVFAMYEDGREQFLIMQRIRGATLESIWDSLELTEKDDITAKLRTIIDTMRETESPWPDFHGGLDGGPIYNPIFWVSGQKYLRPFIGEAALVAEFTSNHRASVQSRKPQSDKCVDYKALFCEQHLGHVFRGHQPKLTHGDLAQRTIMVEENTISRRNNQGDLRRHTRSLGECRFPSGILGIH